MDILFHQIQADLRSNDTLRQSGALLQALQQSEAGRDISVIAKSAVEESVASPASVCKKLSFDLIRSTRLTADLRKIVCTGIRTDLDFPDPDATALAISILAAILSHHLSRLITSYHQKINNCLDSRSDNLRFSITEIFGCILARDDLSTLCASPTEEEVKVAAAERRRRRKQNIKRRKKNKEKEKEKTEEEEEAKGPATLSKPTADV
ncbi:hypothetical protein SAY87_007230 [Trapa incisa]|uniref:Uncharacterized protein n=1 Tax=Trapa incisa TaxID=236973 RepID=A0AAN7K408_9MYRT|nr:hypothetical protein SAY87_007230 [Trapa incisa]